MRHEGHRYAAFIRICKYGAPLLASSPTCATAMSWASAPRAAEGKFFSADPLPDLAGY